MSHAAGDIPSKTGCAQPSGRASATREAAMSALAALPAAHRVRAALRQSRSGRPERGSVARRDAWPPVAVDHPGVGHRILAPGQPQSKSLRSILAPVPGAPYRLALSTQTPPGCVWLPLVGWQTADSALEERLERLYSIPMLCIAMLILPVLAIEILSAKRAAIHPALLLAMDLGTALIWLAFTIEFIVMSSITERKFAYAARHWLNLAIIILPLLAFLRGLQVMRLLRLGKFSKALRLYRLRGLSLRAWRGLVSLEVLEWLLRRDRETRLRHLRRQLRQKEREADRIRARIRALEENGGPTSAAAHSVRRSVVSDGAAQKHD